MKVQIDQDRCQGHGRCYDLAPKVFTEDEEGYGQVVADGTIADADNHQVQLAISNCPENAINVLEEAK